MRRYLVILMLVLSASAIAAGCGFGRADDSGKPIPGLYWGWACGDDDTPPGDAGCPPEDGGAGADAGDAGALPDGGD